MIMLLSYVSLFALPLVDLFTIIPVFDLIVHCHNFDSWNMEQVARETN